MRIRYFQEAKSCSSFIKHLNEKVLEALESFEEYFALLLVFFFPKEIDSNIWTPILATVSGRFSVLEEDDGKTRRIDYWYRSLFDSQKSVNSIHGVCVLDACAVGIVRE